MAEYLNAPNSGVKSYSEEADSEGNPDAITAYFPTGAYTYTRQSVGALNFENMLNLAHDGIGLCRYITANCRMNYASKVAGNNIKPKGHTTQQTSERLLGYWNGTHIPHGGNYNLDNMTKKGTALSNALSSTPLPSGIVKTRRGNQPETTAQLKPRIKIKSSHVASASRSSHSTPKPRIKLKTRK